MAESVAGRGFDIASWIGTVSAMVLGVVLLVAAGTKAIDPVAFSDQIRSEGLDFLLPAGVVALIGLAIESGLGVALFLGLRRLFILLPTLALVIFFLFLTGRTYWRSLQGIEIEESCGCFGNLLDRSPAEAFWQDLALLAIPLALAFVGRRTQTRWLGGRLGMAFVGAAAVTLLGWKAADLPLDDLATRLSPGTVLSAICAGDADAGEEVCLDTLLPGLDDGDHLVVIADLNDDLGQRLAELEALSEQVGGGLWVLTDADKEAKSVFYWQWGPTFEIVEEVPRALLRPLYRSLPRSFRVQGGEVIETWQGLPELTDSE